MTATAVLLAGYLPVAGAALAALTLDTGRSRPTATPTATRATSTRRRRSVSPAPRPAATAGGVCGPTSYTFDSSGPPTDMATADVLAALSPAAVTVGQLDDGSDVIVDLNAIHALAIDLPSHACSELLDHIHRELRWPAEEGAVALAVVDPPDTLTATSRRTTWDALARTRPAPARHAPRIVVAWTTPPPGTAATLADAGVAVISPAPLDGAWRLAGDTHTARLDPPGVRLRPYTNPRATAPGTPATGPAAAATGAAPALDVNVLGPVDITRDGQPITGTHAEVVAYLATHPAGVTGPQLRAALWPNSAISDKRFNNLISETRKLLGATNDGAPRLPLVRGRARYRIDGPLRCDLLTLEDAIHTARNDGTPGQLDAALGTVRGEPYDGWEHPWVEEGGRARAERVIDEARACLRRLSVDDPD